MRPAAWLGRFANSTIERVFVNGALVGGSTGAVRALSAAVRGIQSGYLRYYAALLLDRAHRPGRLLPDLRMTIHLTILVFFPAVCGLLRRVHAAACIEILLIATLDPARLRGMMVADFDPAGGLQHVTDDAWIAELGIRYKLGIDGLNLWLILLTAVIAFASRACGCAVRPPAERAGLFAFHFGARRDRRARRVRGPGPGAVRPLLRPDAGALLLPRRPVGRAGPRRRRR